MGRGRRHVDVAFQDQVRVLQTGHDVLVGGGVSDRRLELRHRLELQIGGIYFLSDRRRLRRGGAHLTEVGMRGLQALEHAARPGRWRFVDEARRFDLE